MIGGLRRAALALLLGLTAQPATAGDAQLLPLVEEGRYREAAVLARALGDAESLALGAGALSVYGHYVAPEAERRAVVEEAAALARLARSKESGAAETLQALLRFQEGQALGRLAESLPRDEREPYAEPVRAAFEAALGHDPQRWEAHAGLANWHAKVMVTADDEAGLFGALGANMLYDASYEEAEAHRAAAAAIEKRPADEKVFLLESAEIRLLLDAEDNAAAARRDLEASLAIAPPNHLGGIVHKRAETCLLDLSACAKRLKASVLN